MDIRVDAMIMSGKVVVEVLGDDGKVEAGRRIEPSEAVDLANKLKRAATAAKAL